MKRDKVNVVFQPSGRRSEVDAGKTVLEAAQALGVAIESVCGGNVSCGKCLVRVEPGSKAPIEEALSPFTSEEGRFIGEVARRQGYRLACAASVREDIAVSVPEETRASRQVIRKEAGEITTILNPAVKACYVALTPPTLENAASDLERLRQALARSFNLHKLDIGFSALRVLPHRLRSGNWKATALVWMDREILDVRPGKVEQLYGAAIDIGTTTIALYLCDLARGGIAATGSVMNPQVAYGEDVMSRITYAIMNPGKGLRTLQQVLVQEINRLVQDTADSVDVGVEDIVDVTVVGNTAMHHILLGIEPDYLGVSPFPPAVNSSLDVKARDVGVAVHPEAYIHVLPVEAGFVGADNVGVLIATRPDQMDGINLIIDVGTNGELVLGNKDKLLSSSCATGPAFEGAHIQFGMRAAPGAIERVSISAETLDVRYQTVGSQRWSHEVPPREIGARGICGSGIIDAVAEMFRAGILEASGRFNDRLNNPRVRRGSAGPEFVLAWAEETATGRDITVSIADVRAVQLGKGALYSGAKIMMKALGADRVDRVLLAGGFGTYIDPEKAMILGMFPDCDLKNVIPVGNAAGDGARLALLNREMRKEADRIAREVEYMELTVFPEFTMEFAEAMAFPHMKDAFPHLKEILRKG